MGVCVCARPTMHRQRAMTRSPTPGGQQLQDGVCVCARPTMHRQRAMTGPEPASAVVALVGPVQVAVSCACGVS
ncbi:MAG: hypothetical protein WDW36_007790 [Sanguina aurantia]